MGLFVSHSIGTGKLTQLDIQGTVLCNIVQLYCTVILYCSTHCTMSSRESKASGMKTELYCVHLYESYDECVKQCHVVQYTGKLLNVDFAAFGKSVVKSSFDCSEFLRYYRTTVVPVRGGGEKPV